MDSRLCARCHNPLGASAGDHVCSVADRVEGSLGPLQWVHRPNDPLKLNVSGMDTEAAIRRAAEMLWMHRGAVATAAVVPWATFHWMLGRRQQTAFPHPGVFVQAANCWVLVTADARLNPSASTGWVRDALTGDCVKLEGLEA